MARRGIVCLKSPESSDNTANWGLWGPVLRRSRGASFGCPHGSRLMPPHPSPPPPAAGGLGDPFPDQPEGGGHNGRRGKGAAAWDVCGWAWVGGWGLGVNVQASPSAAGPAESCAAGASPLSGVLMPDRATPQAAEALPQLRWLQHSHPSRPAVRLLLETCPAVTVLSATATSAPHVQYPWSGESVVHPRRDKRRGTHTAHVTRTERGPCIM
jgi:hypothetical protein